MSQQIQITGGAKVRDLQDVIIGTSGVLSSLAFNVANGVPKLDVNGKILVSQLPNSVMEYKGTWNAATNTPTLVNGTGNQGDVYLCNVAGTVNFGAGPIAFVVGDQVIYSGSIWQRASGATGTVTSVAVTESGDSLNITGSPITTSGTINIGFNGTNLQYVNGAGNLTTFPTLITSIGLSMPSAFSVANSPLTANGTIAVTGAGVASQYIRGDGTLADFPSSGGGGSSVSYYLNGGTSQGTIGGTTYYEMSKTADTGTGVDFTKSGDGFIVAFLTDANDPAQLNIPAGNWNYEIYASMSSNGGTPQLYAELYVYNGTTFTLISTSSNEILYDGTNLNLYSFAMTVPATTLALTDRLAIKLYATNSGGKTTTVHTQDSHLCQIITTFSTGITALNGLTAQVQYFQVGTSGTDFNISSTTATHTFNIPDASATARGLITTGTQTIAGTKTFSDATKNNGGIFLQNASSNSLAGYMNLGGLTNGVKFTSGGGISNTFTLPSSTGYTFTFPNATGTIALTSDIFYPVTSVFGRTGAVVATSGDYTTTQVTEGTNLYYTDVRARASNSFVAGSGAYNSTTGVITIPTDNNQIANGSGFITSSALSNYVALTGNQTIAGVKTFSTYSKFDGGIILKNNVSASLAGYVGLSAYSASGNKGINIDFDTYSASFYFSGTLPYQYTFPAASGTIALVGGSGVGTVTSVAALTIGTSGTDLSSTVSNSTTTPVITLNVPTASATNRGALSSADWTTFNNKQSALTNPVTGTGNNNYIAKFTSTGSTIGNSIVQDNGSTVTIGGSLTLTASSGFPSVGLLNRSSDTTLYMISPASGFTLTDSSLNTIYNATPTSHNWNISNSLKMKLDASGNLGLGVTPSYRLDVQNTSGFDSRFKTTSLGGTVGILLEANNDFSGTSQAYIKAILGGGNGQSTLTFGTATNVGDTTASEKMRLFPSGNLLIQLGGTFTDAGYKLDVNGTGRFSGALNGTSATFSGNVVFNRASTSAGNNIEWRTANTLNWYIGTRGLVDNNFYFVNEGLSVNNLILNASTGAATFSSDIFAKSGTIDSRAFKIYEASAGRGGLYPYNLVTGSGTDYSSVGIFSEGEIFLASGGSVTKKLRIESGGAATFTSSVTATSFFESSDSRLKTLIQDNYQTKGIASITPKLYTKNGKVELGYYAQDFVGVLDSAVSKGSDDMLSLSYREVHTAKIYALEQEIKELKAK
jgi:hypothetical protein